MSGREAAAGVEHALVGMKVGGYRGIHVSPHVAYHEKSILNLISPDAVLMVGQWLQEDIHKRKVYR